MEAVRGHQRGHARAGGLAQWYAWTAYRAAGSPDLWFYRNDGVSTHISLDAEFRLWWVLVGLEPNIRMVYWTLSPHVFDYGIVWLAVSLLLVALRLAFPLAVRPWAPETLSAFDRVLMRVLALSVIWFILGAVWHVVINSVQGIRWIAAAAVASGGIFAALRNWIAVAVRPPKTSGVMAALKPYVPQVLAYLTIVLAAAVVGNVLAAVAANDWFTWYGASAALSGVVAFGLFIDPAEFGMHAFYRDRLTRAFTGASNTEAGPTASRQPRDRATRTRRSAADRPAQPPAAPGVLRRQRSEWRHHSDARARVAQRRPVEEGVLDGPVLVAVQPDAGFRHYGVGGSLQLEHGLGVGGTGPGGVVPDDRAQPAARAVGSPPGR